MTGTGYSPGVRRMMAMVGSDASFEQGREQLELLAGIEVTVKAVERNAEAIGNDIEACEQAEIRRAKQLELPEVCAPAVPLLYIEMDGTAIPIVKAESEGRIGRIEGQPAHTREVKLGCVFTQTTIDQDRRPVRDEESTSYVAAIETAEQFGLRLYTEAWRRGWSRASKESSDRRWRGLDLEPRGTALPGRNPNRRSLPRSSAPLGTLGSSCFLNSR